MHGNTFVHASGTRPDASTTCCASCGPSSPRVRQPTSPRAACTSSSPADDVTECLGGAARRCSTSTSSGANETMCDPRLNAASPSTWPSRSRELPAAADRPAPAGAAASRGRRAGTWSGVTTGSPGTRGTPSPAGRQSPGWRGPRRAHRGRPRARATNVPTSGLGRPAARRGRGRGRRGARVGASMGPDDFGGQRHERGAPRRALRPVPPRPRLGPRTVARVLRREPGEHGARRAPAPAGLDGDPTASDRPPDAAPTPVVDAPARVDEPAPVPAPAVQPSTPPPTPAAAPATETRRGRGELLRGAAARTVTNMEASLGVPTATSVRTVPAKLLEVNRQILNNHLGRTGRGQGQLHAPDRVRGRPGPG